MSSTGATAVVTGEAKLNAHPALQQLSEYMCYTQVSALLVFTLNDSRCLSFQ